jgi:hypothetical protein
MKTKMNFVFTDRFPTVFVPKRSTVRREMRTLCARRQGDCGSLAEGFFSNTPTPANLHSL